MAVILGRKPGGTGGGGGGPPSGPAGGVLSGTYPNPGFASDMATQAELDAVSALISWKLITATVLGANTASFDFTSIPGTYNHLKILASVRGTSAVTNENSLIRFNNDSGGNYDIGNVSGVGDATSGRTDAGATAYNGPRNPGASAVTGSFAGWELDIPWYAGTAAFKTIQGTCIANYNAAAADTVVIDATGGVWRNTAAITRVTLLPGSGNWLSGSRAALYGIT